MSRNYLKHAPGLSVPVYGPPELAPRISQRHPRQTPLPEARCQRLSRRGARGGSEGNRVPSGTAAQRTRRVEPSAAGTLSGVRHGENCGASGRTRSKRYIFWHAAGDPPREAMRITPPRPSPFQQKPALTLPKKALRVNDFVEFRGLFVSTFRAREGPGDPNHRDSPEPPPFSKLPTPAESVETQGRPGPSSLVVQAIPE